MADALAEPQWFNLAKNNNKSMATKVWFITGAIRGIGAEIAKTALVDGNQFVASGRKPAAVTEALGQIPLTQRQEKNAAAQTWK